MNAQELVTQHLDLWTGAVTSKSTAGRGTSSGKRGKIELTGIKKLRELILELAVRGKLVDQDPSDEPASVLLEKIAEEKARLVKEGKIKKPKKHPEITEEEKPFELPRGWTWVRLGNLGVISSSSRVHQKDWQDGGVPFYRAREIVQLARNGSVDNDLFISDGLYSSLTETGFVPEPNDFMITGVGTIGVVYVVKEGDKFYFKDASVLILKNTSKIYPCYLYNFFRSETWIDVIHKHSMGTTVHTLTIARASNVTVPFPPLSEQYRIVEKVDEMMALCDRLEQQFGDQLEAHEVLVDILLDALTRSADAAEVAENWARIAEHFDTFFTTEASIDKLMQAILQLAVMGRLVPQDPNDEPASVLLGKIAEEKARLVKEGKIKKPKELAQSDDEKPYVIPQGWQWQKLGNFTLIGTGATPSRDRGDYYSPPDYPWVSSGETRNRYIYETKERVSSLAVNETNITIYPVGTLVVAMYGQGKTRGQISELKVAAGTNQACAAIQPLGNEDYHREYIKLCFIKLYDEIREGAAGGAQPNLNTGKIANILIPLPPLQEQHRIVEKVDELIAICDQLKARLGEAVETCTHLANAVVEKAVTT